jgi:membrane fusion protein (multidrug efflux system)
MLRMRQSIANGSVERDGSTHIRLTLPDGSTYPIAGRLQFSNASVDETTGSVTLRAVIANPQHLLLSGMYVKALVNQGTLPAAMLIPQQAVTRTPQGEASVLVVGSDNTVSQRVIQAPYTQGDQWVVTSGLTSGERVIVAGSQKIRLMPNMPAPKVNPVMDQAAPSASATSTAPAKS